jgi:hypothetical protein
MNTLLAIYFDRLKENKERGIPAPAPSKFQQAWKWQQKWEIVLFKLPNVTNINLLLPFITGNTINAFYTSLHVHLSSKNNRTKLWVICETPKFHLYYQMIIGMEHYINGLRTITRVTYKNIVSFMIPGLIARFYYNRDGATTQCIWTFGASPSQV